MKAVVWFVTCYSVWYSKSDDVNVNHMTFLIRKEYTIMKKRTRVSIISFILSLVFVMASAMPALAKNCPVGTIVSPEVGYYKIRAASGVGAGEYLYYDKNADWKYLKWNKDGDIFIIQNNTLIGFINGYNICLLHEPDQRLSTLLWMDHTSTGYSLYFDGLNQQYKSVYFSMVKGSDPYKNLLIGFDTNDWNDCYMKRIRKLMANDFVELQNDLSDTDDMLWDLEKINYWVGFEKIGPSISSKNKREVAIKWDKFRKKVKNSPLWKNAEYIEIQCSTDPSFPYGDKTKTKRIKKGTMNRVKAKTTLRGLKNKTTYYVRVCIQDKKGVYSNWSKTVKVKTK